MKIRLLNDGEYGDMENVEFPVEVEAKDCGGYFEVSADELYRVGATAGTFDISNAWAFVLKEHVEVVA